MKTDPDDLQRLPPWMGDGGRPETGPMAFGDDWPGIFIRGDNALILAMHLRGVLPVLPKDNWVLHSTVQGLISLLDSCAVKAAPPEAKP